VTHVKKSYVTIVVEGNGLAAANAAECAAGFITDGYAVIGVPTDNPFTCLYNSSFPVTVIS
jgi:hypothetical protein